VPIYVDTRLSARLFGESDLALLSAMANQRRSIQLARLYEDSRPAPRAPAGLCASYRMRRMS